MTAQVLGTIQKLVKFFRMDKISFEELASNVIIHLVGKPSNLVEACLCELTHDERKQVAEYAANYVSKQFTPHPVAFAVDTNDTAAVERKREEMRPQYTQLLEQLNDFTQ